MIDKIRTALEQIIDPPSNKPKAQGYKTHRY